jgi:hypothetical protein
LRKNDKVLAFFMYLQLQIKKILLQTLSPSLSFSLSANFGLASSCSFWSSCVTTGPTVNPKHLGFTGYANQGPMTCGQTPPSPLHISSFSSFCFPSPYFLFSLFCFPSPSLGARHPIWDQSWKVRNPIYGTLVVRKPIYVNMYFFTLPCAV